MDEEVINWYCQNEHKTVRIFFDQISILNACGTHIYTTSIMCLEIYTSW